MTIYAFKQQQTIYHIMTENYSADYWYNDPSHKAWNFGDENYYVNTFYEKIMGRNFCLYNIC